MAKDLQEDEDHGEEVVANEGPPLPDEADLKKLLKEFSLNAADMDEARGKIGSLMQHAERNKNIHRKAFKLLTQVEKMDETKRAEFLRHLYHYFEVRGHVVKPDLLNEPVETNVVELAPAKKTPKADKPDREKKRRTDAAVMDRMDTH
jgi:hypothetical protein